MNITPKIAMELAAHEGLVRQTYFDSVKKPTWSVGITSASGHSVERYWGNPQSLEKCIEVWLWVLETYADDVRRVFDGYDLTEAQFGSALSFHYNTGAIAKASWVKHWKAGNVAGAKRAFMNWSKPKAIIPRRRAERDLFFDGKWSGDGKITEYTRLTSANTPNWGSGVKRDISDAVNAALRPTKAVKSPSTTQPTENPFAAFWQFLSKIFRNSA